MYSKDMIIGILLALGRPDILIERKNNANIGYRVRLRMCVRGSQKFLDAISRSLTQHDLVSFVKERESSGRPKPILTISGNLNLYKLMDFIPDYLPDCKGEFSKFKEVVNIVANKDHLTSEGFDKILQIKGLI